MTFDFLTALMTSRARHTSNAASFRSLWLASVSIGSAPAPRASTFETARLLPRLKATLARCRNLVSVELEHSRGK
jgi:hypothetical protein